MQTVKTLVVYDNSGYVLQILEGDDLRVPDGVNYIIQEVPYGKRVRTENGIGVNINGENHTLILEDAPLDAIGKRLDAQYFELREVIFELTMDVAVLKFNESEKKSAISELADLLKAIKGGE